MMTSRKLIEYGAAEPFRPFRIRMASGETFGIRHPEMIAVGKTSTKVYIPLPGEDNRPHWHDVALVLMEVLEPIELKTLVGASITIRK